VRTEFEHDSGFKLPERASKLYGYATSADFWGDYGMAVSFVVLARDLTNFLSLPQHGWEKPEDFRELQSPTHMLTSSADRAFAVSEFQVPAGSFHAQQQGPGEVLREFAVDPAARRIYYSRSTW
jgi:hypothetical protein